MNNVQKNYLPGFLKSISGSLASVSLKSIKDSNGRFVQTYTVSWIGNETESATTRAMLESLKQSMLSDPGSKMSTDSDVDVTINTRSQVEMTRPRIVQCDGPCSALKPYSSMKMLGICEHVICEHCWETKPKVPVSEGGSGCPNKECYEEDLAIKACKSCAVQIMKNSRDKMVRCDGPCNALKPLSEMKVLGICDHVVCKHCLDSQPVVPRKDGGTGCPNKECYEEDREACKHHTTKLPAKSSLEDKRPTKAHGLCEMAKTLSPVRKSRGDQQGFVKDYIKYEPRHDCDDVPNSTESESIVSTHSPVRIPSEILQQPFHEHPVLRNQSPGWKTLYIRVFSRSEEKFTWIKDEIPDNWDLLDAVKRVMKKNDVKPSEKGSNDLFKLHHRDQPHSTWCIMEESDLNKPLVQITKEDRLFLALNIPV